MYYAQASDAALPFRDHNVRIIQLDLLDQVKIVIRVGCLIGKNMLVDSGHHRVIGPQRQFGKFVGP